MSAPTYRPGDIAMVDGKAAVWVASRAGTHAWRYLNGAEPFGIEVGPVLGNVSDIAAGSERVDPAHERTKQSLRRAESRIAYLAGEVERLTHPQEAP